MIIDKLKTMLGDYFRTNNKEIRAALYAKAQLFQYTRTITKIKGEFPAHNSIITRVVQGFAPVWNALGDMKIVPNILKAYDQKVNFPIIPDQLEGSYLAELNDLGKSAEDRPITVYAMQELMKATERDVNDLTRVGVYNPARLGEFGFSMNSLPEIIKVGRADADNPMYRVPLAAFTDDNIVDQLDEFEKGIPSEITGEITRIFISEYWLRRYRSKLKKMNLTINEKSDFEKSFSGTYDIVGLKALNGTDIIFTTPNDNFLKLVDNDNLGGVDFVQHDDYTIKVALRFYLGVGFWSNQLVIVNTSLTSGSGLRTDNELYYS